MARRNYRSSLTVTCAFLQRPRVASFLKTSRFNETSFFKNTKLVRRWKLRKRIDLTAKKTKTFQINPNRRFLNNRNRTATSYGEEEEKKKTVRMRTDTALFQGTLVLLIVFGRSASPCWSCRSCERNHRPLVSACKRTEQGAVKSSQ